MAPNRVDPAALVHQAATNPLRRLVPLGGGTHVYFYDPINFRTHHLRVASTEFFETLKESIELGLGARIRQELEAFHAQWPDAGWDQALEDLQIAELVES